MKKYFAIINVYWQRSLAYRFTIISYKVGEFAEVLVLIFMWQAIFVGQETVRGYTLQEMLTYVLIGNIVRAIVRSYNASIVSRDIKNGSLSAHLVRPMSYFSYAMARELGRVFTSALTATALQVVMMLIFMDSLLINLDPAFLAVFSVMTLLAFVIELLIGYTVGLVAFWADEIEGFQASVEKIQKFFAGTYFPLSLLPVTLVQVSMFLPFAYSFYVPAQLYLKRISLVDGLKGLFIQMIWIIILYGISKLVWRRGIRRYEGVGL